MDKLRSIEVFIRVADCGSFSAAALQLDLTSVMVGKYIAGLERHLGARLIERSTRRQSLTDAGRQFLAEGRQVLEQLRWAELSVERLRETPTGRLRISAATTLGECVVAPLAAEFQQTYPDVAIELELSNDVVDLIDGGFDLALRIGALDPSWDLVAKPLGSYCMSICATPAYLARHGVPQSLQDLVAHRCLGHMVWHTRVAWQLRHGDAPTPWPDAMHWRCNSGQALRQAALRGAGLLLQPHVLVADDLAAGRLVEVMPQYAPPARPVHALYRQDRRPLPKLVRFVEFLVQRMPDWLEPRQ